MNLALIFVLACIVLQLVFAAWASKRVHNEKDSLLAGRSLGPWMATFTVFATWFGAETCIGAADYPYLASLAASPAADLLLAPASRPARAQYLTEQP